ncbi:T6SS immunity protein Tli4 family protein [Herbaspirillum huttiense]|uniref:T6SS immunity protein Tli4 family protein n=1 Tax=Herbaspirillum huttiense TaxID=863372 RepID=UPI0039B112BC
MNFKSPFLINGISLVMCTVAMSGDLSLYPGSSTMNKPAIPMTTFCAGRFLIDAPIGSTLSGGNYLYDFTRIEPPQAMKIEDFLARLADREQFLKSEKHESEPSLLRLVEMPDAHSRIHVYWESSFVTTVVEIDGYLWVNGIQFHFRTDAGMSPPPHGMSSRQDYAVSQMKKLLANLRIRQDHDIPTDPGYCFEGGFIANPDWENEEAGIDIDIAGHPDAFVSVWFYPLAMSRHDRPLLERMSSGLQALGQLATAVRTLRKGDRQVGPYQGQEFLVTTPNSGGGRSHSFIWETEGQGTLDTPAIKIELTTGHHDQNSNAQPTSITDAQAMKLWDDVLGSFRLRPTRLPQAASPSP